MYITLLDKESFGGTFKYDFILKLILTFLFILKLVLTFLLIFSRVKMLRLALT